MAAQSSWCQIDYREERRNAH